MDDKAVSKQVTSEFMVEMYGDYTAPYAVTDNDHDWIEDAACHRGIGSMANTAPPGKPCNAQYKYSEAKGRIVLITTRHIRNYQEVFCEYGEEYKLDEKTWHKDKPT